MLLHTNVVLSSCAAVATDQHGRVTEGGCLRVNKKGAGGLAGGLKFNILVASATAQGYECFGIKSPVWGGGQTFEKNQLFILRPDLPHT